MLDKRIILRLCLLVMISLLVGCSAGKVSVKANIPQPLVSKLPLSGYLSYTDTFKNYQYEENEKGRSLSSLAFGPAQQEMFDRVFTQLLTVSESTNSSLDVIIEPEILDLQYTSPSETKLNLYEVWLRYRVKITDAQDQTLADWVVKGFGKTPSATLKTASSAFNAATNIALRDVGAQLAIGFPKQPAIAELLSKKTNYKPASSLGPQVIKESAKELSETLEVESEAQIIEPEQQEQ